MEFRASEHFLDAYLALPERAVECVDRAMLRVVSEPSGAWARQSRVEGELGAAWIVVARCSDVDYHVYWQPASGGSVEFLLLIGR